MKIIELKKEELNSFLVRQKHSQFLQSWEWGELQRFNGFKVFRLGVEDNGELIGVASLIKKNLGLGKGYLFCPRGPAFGKSQITNHKSQINSKSQIQNSPLGADQSLAEKQIIDILFSEIEKLVEKENCIFLRFEPIYHIPDTIYKIQKTIDLEPAKTSVLDISKPKDELLKNMHQKTRYNIRLAERKGVVIREAKEGDFEKFWELMSQTSSRDGFRLHSKEYYKKMLSNNQSLRNNHQAITDAKITNHKLLLCPRVQIPNKSQITNSKSQINSQPKADQPLAEKLDIRLFVAEYEGKIISANIISFFGDMVTYMHGASSNEYRNVMAPYLLQWEVIKKAKELRFKYYDFFGTDEVKWPGVTRFKRGFGGEEVSYPGTYDLVFDGMWYNGYVLVRKIKRSI